MFCSNCGNELKDDMKFCNKCGNKIGKTINNRESTDIEDREKSEGWKKMIIISIVMFIITLILKLCTNGFIWYLLNVFLIGSFIFFIVGFFIGGYKMKKQKTKLPIWYMFIIGIIIVSVIIGIIAKYSRMNMDKKFNEAYNRAMGTSETGKNDKIKTFDETASQYGMTSDELQEVIEKGITPSELKK